jgi:hypothetical protein
MDGIGSQESPSEILGRLFPKLSEIQNIKERADKAFEILIQSKLPSEEWNTWLDPLFEEGGAVSYSISIMKDDKGIPIGLEAKPNYT